MATDDEGDTGQRHRPLRADAQRNEDRLLRAAAAAFAREGADASVKDIAREAGVGVGTLYRRFPSKELLIEATYRHEVRILCEAAPELAAALPPEEALRTWMERFVDFMTTKHGMADALRVVLTDDDERQQTRAHLAAAVGRLLTAGDSEGAVRPQAKAHDVLMALGGISVMADTERRPDLTAPLIDLLLHGILTN
ncbi:TetR/AcrR family transcriptional regulator [Streptomyces fuscichromogenes]|uniref:TetR family transcriptional regulator n=1 Tax=Streptomyces fuscichromogenes TaxID=1324013 RepID=A0A918CVQ0_9ACTN|nr:TetR/AcrR family transcriptional regulator [Streptomyces fuscichromogenes]GGN34215.1 TetR family transcriptional regulator [Streptomyces fuscichromogenes]